MDPVNDILQKRADQLDLGRQDELALIQRELDKLFKEGQVWARKIDHVTHTLSVEVINSSMASVVRLSQIQILARIKDLTRIPIEKILLRVQ